jgi:hypothetical protein
MMLNTFEVPIINLPPIRKNFDKMIKKQMVEPYKQVVAKAAPPAEEMTRVLYETGDTID